MLLSRLDHLDEETMETTRMDKDRLDKDRLNYSELLFAYHVRELAMKRLVHETPGARSPKA